MRAILILVAALSLGTTPVPIQHIGGPAAPWRAYSGFSDSARVVVTDSGAWREVWAKLNAGMTPLPAPPHVDWAHTMVVVVAAGVHRTGGVIVRVDSAAVRNGALELFITRSLPGLHCVVESARSQPADVVVLPRRPEPMRFIVRSTVENCD